MDGSHVAGIAAAITNNIGNNGVAGVDWQARIHSRNVINNNSGDADVTRGINGAVNFSPNVWTLNHSYGLIQGIDVNGNGIPGRSSVTVRSAFANSYRSNRVSCVAMGNHQVYSGGIYANQVAFPAGFNSGLIAVGATNITDGIGNFSANGPHVDVSAPGVNITSTNFNNGYINLDGTSMATPHVSGLASLLKGFNTNLANDDIEQIIRLTADDANAAIFPGFDNQMGAGRINAQRALQSLQAPNQLFHWSATGGSIFTSGVQQTRNFLGFPGLSDGRYTVIRREVRTNVTFPTQICTTVGTWGRGVGTTGYREDGNTCYGEGICEVVPGTLTNTGATLRTWIYDVWNFTTGQYLGTYPKTTTNVVFQYTLLGVPRPTAISGDDIICTTPKNYTIPNLPIGATLQWQALPAGIVNLSCTNCASTTLTGVSSGIITLTATIANACGGGTITLTKQNIRVGPPSGIGIVGYNNLGTCDDNSYFQVLAAVQPATLTYSGSLTVAETSGVVSNVTWSLPPFGSSGSWSWYASGNTVTVGVKQSNVSLTLRATATNSCGTVYKDYHFNSRDCLPMTDLVGGGEEGGKYSIGPNPSNGTFAATVKDPADPAASIKEIIVKNKLGTVVKHLKFNNRSQSQTVNVQNLPTDVYVVQIFTGKEWFTGKLIKQ